jgi:hypothetical protein
MRHNYQEICIFSNSFSKYRSRNCLYPKYCIYPSYTEGLYISLKLTLLLFSTSYTCSSLFNRGPQHYPHAFSPLLQRAPTSPLLQSLFPQVSSPLIRWVTTEPSSILPTSITKRLESLLGMEMLQDIHVCHRLTPSQKSKLERTQMTGLRML